jgi:hypothetical protein
MNLEENESKWNGIYLTLALRLYKKARKPKTNYFIDIKPSMIIYDGTDDILFVCRFAWIWQ